MCNWFSAPQFSLLQNADNSDYFVQGTQYMLVIITLWFLLPFICFQGNYHILPKILFFSLIPSFFSSALYEPLAIWVCFLGYTIFCKYPSETVVPRTENSVRDEIQLWQSALG